jgi:ribonuclease P protein component
VLPAAARLRARADFAATVRKGRRGRSPLVLVHLSAPSTPGSTPPTRAGFVVSRAVGGAVVRNQVKRRLRALLADRLPTLPAGSQVVVRALPAAATATSPQLAAALDRALAQSLPRASVPTTGGSR